jgi:hypothetical protein
MAEVIFCVLFTLAICSLISFPTAIMKLPYVA